MKSPLKLAISALALLGLAVPVFAGIHKFALGTSADLAEASAELHGYMHGAFGNSYGSHGMETDSQTANDVLENWDAGLVTEADVDAAVQVVNDTFDAMRIQFVENDIWDDKTAKKMYDDVHKLKVLLTAYTN